MHKGSFLYHMFKQKSWELIKPVSKQNFIYKSLHECKNFGSSLERRDHKFLSHPVKSNTLGSHIFTRHGFWGF
jgi:hypothetical protein